MVGQVQGVIIPHKYREHEDGWTPTVADVRRFESGVNDFLHRQFPDVFGNEESLNQYMREYTGGAGLVPGDGSFHRATRVLSANFMCEYRESEDGWPIGALGGGACYFLVTLDMDTDVYAAYGVYD